MHFQDMFARYPATFSFEFFPPRDDEGSDDLYTSINELVPLKPNFVSVTYGAGGSTRELTHKLVLRIKNEGELDPMAANALWLNPASGERAPWNLLWEMPDARAQSNGRSSLPAPRLVLRSRYQHLLAG